MKRPRLLFLALLIACGCSPSPPLEKYGQVPEFTLTAQDGRTVRRDDLDGKVWVACFIFTRCGGPCPQVVATMSRLQDQVADQPDVRLVTFTVDPEHDTPEVLKRYATAHQANSERWLFLTGPEEAVHPLISGGFLQGVEKAKGTARQPGNEVIHSTRLVLVDRHGQMRGFYDGRERDEQSNAIDNVPHLKRDILNLLKEKS